MAIHSGQFGVHVDSIYERFIANNRYFSGFIVCPNDRADQPTRGILLIYCMEDQWNLSDEQLLTLLGEKAVADQGLSGIGKKSNPFDVGQQLFNAYQKELKGSICKKKKLIKLAQSEDYSTLMGVAGLLIPLIEPLVIPGSAGLVSILLIRYGILKLCAK